MKRQYPDAHKIGRVLRNIAPFIGLALAVLPAVWPYFEAGLPRTNDALPHLYRSLALTRLVRQGILWPRWSPDLAHGYGYPVFNFSPSLSHYLVVLWHLIGLPLTTAYRAAVALIFVLTVWSAYLLGRELLDAAGGWVAALAYVYSPYVLYDAIVRGSLQESLALALIPLLCFTLHRAAQRGGYWVIASAFTLAAIPLSHPPISIQTSIPVGVFLLWLGWSLGWRRLWRPLAGLAVGGLLFSFFWLPAFTEVRYVQTEIAVSRGYHYPNNFLPLQELLTWPRMPADPALINPPVVRSLPLIVLALAAILLPWKWRTLNSKRRVYLGVWVSLLFICTALILPLTRPLWDRFSLLQLSLYPWRFLGLTALAGAFVLAGVSAGSTRTPASLLLITAVILIGAIPWLYPPRESVPEAPTVADLVVFEYPPLFIGTTTLGEFLPVWVEQFPDTAELSQQLSATPSVPRLAPAEGVTVQHVVGSPLDATYRLHIERPATLIYRQFYFPGWRASLDGQSLSVAPSQPEGLLQIEVPAGTHDLHVYFGSTPARLLGWILTGLSLSGCMALLLFKPRWLWVESSPASTLLSETTPSTAGLPLSWLGLLTGLILALWLFFSAVDTPLRGDTLTPEGLRGVQHSLMLDFAGELRLLGYEQPQYAISGDTTARLTLYWQALRPIGVPYHIVVQVIDQHGLIWDTQSTARPLDWRWAPGTDFWTPDYYVMDPYIISLLDGIPPGEYTFRVSLVRADTGQTIATQHVGALTVSHPARAERPLEAGLTPISSPTGAGLELLGSQLDRAQAAPGDPVRVTLLWQVMDPVSLPSNPVLTLNLVTSTGAPILTSTSVIAPQYPIANWRPDDRLRTEILLRLPARTPPGEHIWQARIEQTMSLTLPNALLVHEIERQWTPPPLAIPLDTRLEPVATLLGANVVSPLNSLPTSHPLTVTLVWQAEAESEKSYHVFVHVLDPAGNIIAQNDAAPAQWQRPTTSWLHGEIVLDEHVLGMPVDTLAGDYTLLCGLYDPETGDRLTTPTGSDAIFIETFYMRGPD